MFRLGCEDATSEGWKILTLKHTNTFSVSDHNNAVTTPHQYYVWRFKLSSCERLFEVSHLSDEILSRKTRTRTVCIPRGCACACWGWSCGWRLSRTDYTCAVFPGKIRERKYYYTVGNYSETLLRYFIPYGFIPCVTVILLIFFLL